VFYYKAYGLSIGSQLSFGELPLQPQPHRIDVEILQAELSPLRGLGEVLGEAT